MGQRPTFASRMQFCEYAKKKLLKNVAKTPESQKVFISMWRIPATSFHFFKIRLGVIGYRVECFRFMLSLKFIKISFFARLEKNFFNYLSSIPILNTFNLLNTYESVKMFEKNWRAVVIFNSSFGAGRLQLMVF